jgi:hypothetical protein
MLLPYRTLVNAPYFTIDLDQISEAHPRRGAAIAVNIAKLLALRLYRLGKDMGDRKDNRMCFHERWGVLSVLGRAVCS